MAVAAAVTASVAAEAMAVAAVAAMMVAVAGAAAADTMAVVVTSKTIPEQERTFPSRCGVTKVSQDGMVMHTR